MAASGSSWLIFFGTKQEYLGNSVTVMDRCQREQKRTILKVVEFFNIHLRCIRQKVTESNEIGLVPRDVLVGFTCVPKW